MLIERRNLPADLAPLSEVAALAVQGDVTGFMHRRSRLAASAFVDFVVIVRGLAR
jgi:hypothetical protein